MDWLGLIVALTKALAMFSKYLGDKQLIDRGRADAIAFGLAQTLRNVEKANEAAAAVDDPDSEFAKRVRQRFERKPGE